MNLEEEMIMSSTGMIILGSIWLLLSPLWFWAENTVVGIVWLCAGIVELIFGLVRRNKEREIFTDKDIQNKQSESSEKS